MNTLTIQKKASLILIILCSFTSFIYLQMYNANYCKNDFKTKIDENREIILQKNKNNFDQNSLIKIVTKNIINVIIINGK